MVQRNQHTNAIVHRDTGGFDGCEYSVLRYRVVLLVGTLIRTAACLDPILVAGGLNVSRKQILPCVFLLFFFTSTEASFTTQTHTTNVRYISYNISAAHTRWIKEHYVSSFVAYLHTSFFFSLLQALPQEDAILLVGDQEYKR
jgi:hypothetical protein